MKKSLTHISLAVTAIAIASWAHGIEPIEFNVEGTLKAEGVHVHTTAMGTGELTADVVLNVNSDGIDPVMDELRFLVESGPQPNEGEHQPCWLVIVPPGCFAMIREGRYELTDSCKFTVKLVDDANQTETDLTSYVTAFAGSVWIREKVNVVAKLEFETEQIAPVGAEPLPCWITFQIGNDGVEKVPLISKLELLGTVDGM